MKNVVEKAAKVYLLQTLFGWGVFLIILVILAIVMFSSPAHSDEGTEAAFQPEQAVVELHITKKELPTMQESKKASKGTVEQFGGRATCSGSFIAGNGDIITAGHCAQDATSITVVTYDNKEYEATIVATSAIHDLALLHIDRRDTPHFKLAANVVRGERIFILGSPLAISNSLSTGIIAKIAGDTDLVDCGALPGNSGSAVYDDNNQMIGVLTAGYIVGMGTTHLNVIQSLDTVWFFLVRAFSGAKQ